MEKIVIFFIERLSSSNQMFLIKACKDINKKSVIEEEVIKICESSIEKVEDDDYEMYGKIISRTESTPKEFLESIKDSSTKILLFFKLIFSCAYFDSSKDGYKLICDYIDLTIDLRKKTVLMVINNLKQLSDDEQEYYISLLPWQTVNQMSEYFGVEYNEITPKVLKKVYGG